ncbi:hypothetical protein [Stutzerimonas kunmingensis]|uniref:hypothetical protein n=1 Tax=Stutzerimonas kunmingensis TaxID=1211807 RepID=UPI000CE3482F|nr:hypothetical protein [Stutzerimonas kunmingensis]
MAKRIKFTDLLPIYISMQNKHGNTYELVVTNELILRSLELALDEGNADESGLTVIYGDYNAINIGDVFTLNVEQPRLGLGILATDFATYLKAPGAKVKERKNFYLIESSFYSGSAGTAPPVVSRYRQLLRFVALLSQSAHYLDEMKEEMIFYKDGRFVVPLNYDEEVIRRLDVQSFENLERFVLDPLHRDQKLKMLSENLLSILGAIPEQKRFAYLVDSVAGLYKRIQTSYELFVADHSYEKALAEVNSFKIEAITKIHQALTDIQAQVLGIPIATFIALSQLKVTNSLNGQFATNSIIFLGVIVFCVLLVGFLVNQNSTLDTIKSEVERQELVFERKFLNDASIYTSSFLSIKSRLCWQKAAIKAIGVLVFLMLAVSVIYYVVHTRSIYNLIF